METKAAMISTRWGRLALLGLVTIGAFDGRPRAEEADPVAQELRVHHYRMRGKVRLLLFWVGKDEVGGGQISVGRISRENGRNSRSVEVFFGSNPERVPGGINRWGYGQETAEWVIGDNLADPILKETLFAGFMKHSMEKGLSEALANDTRAKSGAQFWYEGTRSLVRRERAVTELRKFSTSQDFDYRDSQAIRCAYHKRLLSGPDKKRELLNSAESYREPYGFLTAVQTVIGTALTEYARNRRLERHQEELSYVYNAQLYELRTRGRRLIKQLEVQGGKGKPSDIYPLVARIDFRVRKISVSGHHDFTLWFPLEGDLKGVPVRILDRPRWWLGIELFLEPTKPSEPVQKVTCE